MFAKILIANRGEIAIRVARAARELGVRSVAVYTEADRSASHRHHADEAYRVGDPGSPLGGYLDAQAIVDTAARAGADAIHPGYGFLSESATLAAACEEAGITFVGPPRHVLDNAGNKVAAKAAAVAAGLPVLAATDVIDRDGPLHEAAERIGFPLFVKAAHGGGGRGLRLVLHPDALGDAVSSAANEAESGFGIGSVYLEQALLRPRHVEVQVLADGTGEIVHLFERDCSIQRRHQKLLEIAPAPGLPDTVRDALCRDAVAFARAVDYVNAGTVEFLVDAQGQHYFIEMNPRIQVEHTITEEICGVDLVRSQIEVAAGARLADLGLTQASVRPHGVAIQCRVLAEDPSNDFRPSTGHISAYRPAGGPGVRVDAGTLHLGAEVSPHFDSLLAKLTTWAPDLDGAARRAARALEELTIAGVATNVAYLHELVSDAEALRDDLSTSFVDERPELRALPRRDHVRDGLLQYLCEVSVRRPNGEPPSDPHPATTLPAAPVGQPPAGTRDRLLRDGPDAFASWLRSRPSIGLTDTSMRDAHQSLFATRMRTADMLAVAPHLAHGVPELLSLEVWGGATFDAAYRFLLEDPWDRLQRLRTAIPNICLQMLLRGQNTVGYERYPTPVVRAFVREACVSGVDVFRIFDAFNDVEQMRPAIDAVREHGRLAEGTLCYTGDVADPNESTYTLDYYLPIAERLIEAGANVLCIKDMAGLLRAPAARVLVSALRREFDAPVHLHTHDTAGGQIATYLAAIEAGVDAVDGAPAPLSGVTSQPSLAAIVAATNGTERESGLDLGALAAMEPYWQAVRTLYGPFDMSLPAPSTRVYEHQIPGGQLTNLMHQAVALGVDGGFPEIERRYIEADRLLGGLIKVTPTSKVVGDLALHMAMNRLDPEDLADGGDRIDLPTSVVELLAGHLGVPAAGWPEPFRSRALQHHAPASAADAVSDDQLESASEGAEAQQRLSALLFPGPHATYVQSRAAHGDLSVLPTDLFFFGLPVAKTTTVVLPEGQTIDVRLDAVGPTDTTGTRRLHLTVDGESRIVRVQDPEADTQTARRESADASDRGHLSAHMAGIVTLHVTPGDFISEGDVVGIIEAMKMETQLRAPCSGRIDRIVTPTGTQVAPDDLVLAVGAATPSEELSPA